MVKALFSRFVFNLLPSENVAYFFFSFVAFQILASALTDAIDPNIKADVEYNGMSRTEFESETGFLVKKLCAYVDQADIHMPLLTVKETLQFAVDNAISKDQSLINPELKQVSLFILISLVEFLNFVYLFRS
jgi:hypothetical protein